jgi:hypothetical protein
MQWIDLQHKITLEKTLTLIKEQLTGAGLDVRLAKTKSAFQDDIKFKMDYLLISMNEDSYVNYRSLSQIIAAKPEYSRRFIIINMDDPKYSILSVLQDRPDNNWVKQPSKMESLAAKAIKNENDFNSMMDGYSLRLEYDTIKSLIDSNPEIFVESEDESVENMVKETIEDLLKQF